MSAEFKIWKCSIRAWNKHTFWNFSLICKNLDFNSARFLEIQYISRKRRNVSLWKFIFQSLVCCIAWKSVCNNHKFCFWCQNIVIFNINLFNVFIHNNRKCFCYAAWNVNAKFCHAPCFCNDFLTRYFQNIIFWKVFNKNLLVCCVKRRPFRHLNFKLVTNLQIDFLFEINLNLCCISASIANAIEFWNSTCIIGLSLKNNDAALHKVEYVALNISDVV